MGGGGGYGYGAPQMGGYQQGQGGYGGQQQQGGYPQGGMGGPGGMGMGQMGGGMGGGAMGGQGDEAAWAAQGCPVPGPAGWCMYRTQDTAEVSFFVRKRTPPPHSPPCSHPQTHNLDAGRCLGYEYEYNARLCLKSRAHA
jgi:hypothetical protein